MLDPLQPNPCLLIHTLVGWTGKLFVCRKMSRVSAFNIKAESAVVVAIAEDEDKHACQDIPQRRGGRCFRASAQLNGRGSRNLSWKRLLLCACVEQSGAAAAPTRDKVMATSSAPQGRDGRMGCIMSVGREGINLQLPRNCSGNAK